LKILIIRLSSIGDIVLTTPVLRCIKNQQADITIHYLLKKKFKEVLIHNPYIDTFHYYEDNLWSLLFQLKKEKFDYIIDLHNNIRSHIISFFLCKKTYRLNKQTIHKWRIVQFKDITNPIKHITKRYLDVVNPLGIIDDGGGLEFYFDQENDKSAVIKNSFHPNYIVLVIGALKKTKQLPTNKLLAICKHISYPIVLIGGKAEKSIAEKIKIECGDKIYNTVGDYNILESASIIKNAQLIITPDTGMMHIAAAFGKIIISIWGNTVPEFGMSPYLPNDKNHIIEVKKLACRPCSKIGYNECPQGHFKCMNDINIDTISAIIKSVITG